MTRVVVTGGTGFIGRHVLRALAQLDTTEVLVLSRSAHAASGRATYRQGDIGDPRGVEELVAGADIVVHLAGCKKNPGEFEATNVEGTRNILEACERANVRRLIYMSSVGVIGPTSEQVVTEQTPCHPANGYEQSKYAAEVMVKAFSTRRPGTTTILRPTNVFGEHDPELHLLNLIRRVKTHRFFFVGRDVSPYYVNYLYAPEIGALVVRLLASVPASDLYIVNTPTPLAAFIAAIKNLLNDPTAVGHLPFWLVKTAAVAGDRLPRALVPRPPINSLKLAESSSRKQYSAALLTRELPWTPAFRMEEALRNIMAHYREEGLLT